MFECLIERDFDYKYQLEVKCIYQTLSNCEIRQNNIKRRKNAENGEIKVFAAIASGNLFLIAILINLFPFYCAIASHRLALATQQFETMVLFVMVFSTVAAKTVMTKKSERVEKQVDELMHNDGWSGNYINDWDHGEVKQITIEKKIPIFVEKIRHVPIVQKEYISVPRYITKPIYIERSIPFILPRLQHYHHHHYSEYHHLH